VTKPDQEPKIPALTAETGNTASRRHMPITHWPNLGPYDERPLQCRYCGNSLVGVAFDETCPGPQQQA
jgi:hypothetical protein